MDTSPESLFDQMADLPGVDELRKNPLVNAWFEINRSLFIGFCRMGNDLMHAASGGAEQVADETQTAASTVAGQTRSAAERTTTAIADNVNRAAAELQQAFERAANAFSSGTAEVFGQARAQAERVMGAAEEAASDTADEVAEIMDAGDADDDGRGTPYEDWTKAELYDRAQELDIAGRSGMSKQQLIAALRAD